MGWGEGKRSRKWVYGKTEREVLGKLADLRRRQEQGQNLAAAPRTAGEWLDEWLRMKERDGKRPSTLQGYRKLIENHVCPALGRLALDKLTPTVIRRLLAEKTDAGLSATTVRHIHGLIRNSLGDAEREELVHRNAAKSVRPPAMRQIERRALGVDEAKRLHDLRHACATFLLVSGASPRTVMKVLGYSQIGLTMNTYAHVLPEIERTAVDEAAKHLSADLAVRMAVRGAR
ncbi:site-specific integrase [Micromonospora sp. NPDC085948]|uniref:site-specific integrase n=1 Tax=Micromonospora sp. NPDC085948 TaxID=3155293 RepID=UPI003429557E